MNLSKIKNLSARKKFAVVATLALGISTIIAILASQQAQNTRSKAAESTQVGYKAVDTFIQPGSGPEVVPGEVLIKLKSSANLLVPDQISVDNPGRESLRQLNKAVRAERFERVLERKKGVSLQNQPETAWYKVKSVTNPGVSKAVSRSRNQAEFDQVLALVEQYKKDPDVEIAEPNYVARAALTPNDTYYASRNFFNGYDDMYWTRKTNMPVAWDATTGNNIVVAVIDSGVDRFHPDLSVNMTNGWDFVNNDSDPNDDHGHGTHVAGILGAVGNNSRQVTGVNWRVKIMALKVLDSAGSGTVDNIVRGLRYSADNGAKISNLSLNCPCDSQILNEAVNYGHDRGQTVVVAAGNDNTDVSYNSLANSTWAIAVGATDPYDQKASFSNYGPKIDVVAPGVDILSLVSNVSPMCGVTTGGYNKVCWGGGTSFAAPQVAGLSALMLSMKPSLTHEDIRSIIRNSARDIGAPGRDSNFGSGMIDAVKALAQVSGTTANPTPTSPPEQQSPSNSIPVGTIDSLSCNQISGWAYDPDKSSQSIRVDIYIDGVGAASITANQYRSDVNSARGISGNHGFSWTVPSQYRDSRVRSVAAYAIGVDSNGNLNGENPQITAYSFSSNGTFGPCQSTAPTPTSVPPTPTPTRAPTSAPTGINRYLPYGVIDALSCSQFRGWSYDADKPSYSNRIDIYIDNVGAASIYANQYRPDVNSARGITGNHGFSWILPSKYRDGRSHSAQIYAIGVDSNGNLNGENPQITAYSFSSNGTFGPCY